MTRCARRSRTRPREGVLEQLELLLAPDERRRDAERAARLLVRPRRARQTRTLAREAAHRRAARPAGRRPGRGRAACTPGPEQDLARLGRLLQAGRDVDRLAGRERRLGVVGDDLAGLDPDPHLEAELGDRFEDRERSANAALGVVLVRLRDAERGHDGVAGELLDHAAVR